MTHKTKQDNPSLAPKSHLFVIDPLKKLNLSLDTSLRIAHALNKAGDQIYTATPQDIYLQATPTTLTARVTPLTWQDPKDPQSLTPQNPQTLDLKNLDSIHFRKDPPTDATYWETTWLLDFLPTHTRQYNPLKQLRDANEKVIIAHYPQHAIPCLITAQAQAALEFAQSAPEQTVVIKPLQLYGGYGVHKLSLKDLSPANFISKFQELTQDGQAFRIVQHFSPEIYNGEIRVFTAFGHPIAWGLKVPAPGNFLANTGHGAAVQPYSPSPAITAMVEEIAQDLHNQGIALVGFDIIGQRISELNITSPRLLAPELKPEYFSQIAAAIHQDLNP